jgi:hypothetical protein
MFFLISNFTSGVVSIMNLSCETSFCRNIWDKARHSQYHKCQLDQCMVSFFVNPYSAE